MVRANDGNKLSRIVSPEPLGAPAQPSRIARVFRPDSCARAVWDVASALFVLWYVLTVPYRIAFFSADHLTPPVLLVELLVDAFFVADIYLQYNDFPYMEAGVVIIDRQQIRERYRATWMMVDCVASLPVDVLIFVFGDALG